MKYSIIWGSGNILAGYITRNYRNAELVPPGDAEVIFLSGKDTMQGRFNQLIEKTTAQVVVVSVEYDILEEISNLKVSEKIYMYDILMGSRDEEAEKKLNQIFCK
jgi:hypothetical protein